MENESNNGTIDRKRLIILCVLYAIALVWVFIFKCNHNESLCLEFSRSLTVLERLQWVSVTECPFCVFFDYSIPARDWTSILAFPMNVIGFIPLGILLRYFYEKFPSYLIALGVCLSVELIQLFTGYGGFSLGDIFLNSTGAYFGLLIYDVAFSKIKPQTFNKTATVLIYTTSPLALFFIVNTIINFPG